MVLAQPCRFRALMASVTVSPRAVLPLKLGLGVLFGSRKGILELKIDTIADRGFLPLPAIDQSGAGSIGISAGGKRSLATGGPPWLFRRHVRESRPNETQTDIGIDARARVHHVSIGYAGLEVM